MIYLSKYLLNILILNIYCLMSQVNHRMITFISSYHCPGFCTKSLLWLSSVVVQSRSSDVAVVPFLSDGCPTLPSPVAAGPGGDFSCPLPRVGEALVVRKKIPALDRSTGDKWLLGQPAEHQGLARRQSPPLVSPALARMVG